jgi:hypothetical protein
MPALHCQSNQQYQQHKRRHIGKGDGVFLDSHGRVIQTRGIVSTTPAASSSSVTYSSFSSNARATRKSYQLGSRAVAIQRIEYLPDTVLHALRRANSFDPIKGPPAPRRLPSSVLHLCITQGLAQYFQSFQPASRIDSVSLPLDLLSLLRPLICHPPLSFDHGLSRRQLLTPAPVRTEQLLAQVQHWEEKQKQEMMKGCHKDRKTRRMSEEMGLKERREEEREEEEEEKVGEAEEAASERDMERDDLNKVLMSLSKHVQEAVMATGDPTREWEKRKREKRAEGEGKHTMVVAAPIRLIFDPSIDDVNPGGGSFVVRSFLGKRLQEALVLCLDKEAEIGRKGKEEQGQDIVQGIKLLSLLQLTRLYQASVQGPMGGFPDGSQGVSFLRFKPSLFASSCDRICTTSEGKPTIERKYKDAIAERLDELLELAECEIPFFARRTEEVARGERRARKEIDARAAWILGRGPLPYERIEFFGSEKEEQEEQGAWEECEWRRGRNHGCGRQESPGSVIIDLLTGKLEGPGTDHGPQKRDKRESEGGGEGSGQEKRPEIGCIFLLEPLSAGLTWTFSRCTEEDTDTPCRPLPRPFLSPSPSTQPLAYLTLNMFDMAYTDENESAHRRTEKRKGRGEGGDLDVLLNRFAPAANDDVLVAPPLLRYPRLPYIGGDGVPRVLMDTCWTPRSGIPSISSSLESGKNLLAVSNRALLELLQQTPAWRHPPATFASSFYTVNPSATLYSKSTPSSCITFPQLRAISFPPRPPSLYTYITDLNLSRPIHFPSLITGVVVYFLSRPSLRSLALPLSCPYLSDSISQPCLLSLLQTSWMDKQYAAHKTSDIFVPPSLPPALALVENTSNVANEILLSLFLQANDPGVFHMWGYFDDFPEGGEKAGQEDGKDLQLELVNVRKREAQRGQVDVDDEGVGMGGTEDNPGIAREKEAEVARLHRQRVTEGETNLFPPQQHPRGSCAAKEVVAPSVLSSSSPSSFSPSAAFYTSSLSPSSVPIPTTPMKSSAFVPKTSRQMDNAAQRQSKEDGVRGGLLDEFFKLRRPKARHQASSSLRKDTNCGNSVDVSTSRNPDSASESCAPAKCDSVQTSQLSRQGTPIALSLHSAVTNSLSSVSPPSSRPPAATCLMAEYLLDLDNGSFVAGLSHTHNITVIDVPLYSETRRGRKKGGNRNVNERGMDLILDEVTGVRLLGLTEVVSSPADPAFAAYKQAIRSLIEQSTRFDVIFLFLLPEGDPLLHTPAIRAIQNSFFNSRAEVVVRVVVPGEDGPQKGENRTTPLQRMIRAAVNEAQRRKMDRKTKSINGDAWLQRVCARIENVDQASFLSSFPSLNMWSALLMLHSMPLRRLLSSPPSVLHNAFPTLSKSALDMFASLCQVNLSREAVSHLAALLPMEYDEEARDFDRGEATMDGGKDRFLQKGYQHLYDHQQDAWPSAHALNDTQMWQLQHQYLPPSLARDAYFNRQHQQMSSNSPAEGSDPPFPLLPQPQKRWQGTDTYPRRDLPGRLDKNSTHSTTFPSTQHPWSKQQQQQQQHVQQKHIYATLRPFRRSTHPSFRPAASSFHSPLPHVPLPIASNPKRAHVGLDLSPEATGLSGGQTRLRFLPNERGGE